MSKKSFNTEAATTKLFSRAAQEPQETQGKPDTHDTHEKPLTEERLLELLQESKGILAAVPEEEAERISKRGRHKKAEAEKLRGYRYNLNLDRDLQQYLKETAWKNRTSITQYINDLIRADMEAYFRQCEAQGIDPKEGWEVDET